MNIHVTEQDIKNGQRFNAFDCPIALAISRQVGGFAEVRAGSIKIHNGSTMVEIQTPLMGELTSRICEFDSHGKGEPFSFSLNYRNDNGLEMEYSPETEELVEA